MSYIVKQKIKGKIYLYRVESYWNKEKKQSRQKRIYLGPEQKAQKGKKFKNLDIIYKKYGNIFLLNKITERLGLKKILLELFSENYKEIIFMAFFHVCSESANYMFPYWLHEQYNSFGANVLYSSEISALCESIGLSQTKVRDFFKLWIESREIKSRVYYDVTSISSYGTNIDFLEWGYNRDGEELPQVNVGLACEDEGIPLFYQIYPGSIPDVATLRNSLKLFDYYNFKGITLILDRGFCSKANILEINKLKENIKFIQPMTMSMKKVLELFKKNRKKLKNFNTAFKFKEEILHYCKDVFSMDENDFVAHIYYNDKIEICLRNNLLSDLLEIKEKHKNEKFTTMKSYLEYKNNNIPEKYKNFVKLNKKEGSMVLNEKVIKSHAIKSSYFIFITNSEEIDKSSNLMLYRNRDVVEKLFDAGKNALGADRLRAHSQYNIDGKMFIKFIALILHNEISNIMKKKKLFDSYSLVELLAELSKIRCSFLNKDFIVSEISKSQKNILEAFNITSDMLLKPSY